MSQAPAGWYPQPDGGQRYWDGTAWTEHFAPGVQQPAEAAASPGTTTIASTSEPTAEIPRDEPARAETGAPGPPFGPATASPERPWFKKKRVLIPTGFLLFSSWVLLLTRVTTPRRTPPPVRLSRRRQITLRPRRRRRRASRRRSRC